MVSMQSSNIVVDRYIMNTGEILKGDSMVKAAKNSHVLMFIN